MIRLLCVVIGLFITVVSVAQNNFRTRQSGDWNQSATWEEFIAGTWQLTANTPNSGSGTITLQSPHVVTVTAAVTIDQTTVNLGATLTLNDAIPLTLNQGAGNDLIVTGIINFLGESFIDGGGNIVLNGTLRTGSLNSTGALVAGTTVGNIRVTTRTYNSGSRVIYNGTGAQFFGSGQPSSSGVDTEIDNSNGITFNNLTTGNPGGGLVIPGALILTSGYVNISTVSGTGRTLILRGVITDNGNNITMSGPCSLRIEGSGAVGTFPFPAGNQTMFNFVFNRPGETVTFSNQMSFTGDVLVTSGSVIFNSAASIAGSAAFGTGTIDFNGTTSITGSVLLGSGTTLSFEGQSLTFGNNFTTAGGSLSSDLSSSLFLTGSVAHASPLSFTGGSELNTLSMTMTNAGTSATIGSAVNVTTALNLTDGILDNTGGNLSLSNGSTITKSSEGSIISSSPSGGPWNLIYTMNSQSTGLEIPPSGSLSSLTISTNNSTVVTLGQSITVTNSFTIPTSARTFISGTNNVSVGSFSNTGVFNAPTSGASTGFTVSGNFVNNGTFTHNSGTLIIDGTSVMSGSTINSTNFNTINITAAGALTAPTTLNIAGNFSNDGAFTSGTGTVVFNGAVSTLSGATIGTTNFYAVTVNSGATLVLGVNFILQSNFVMNGSLTAGSGTTTFIGTTVLSGTNITTALFNHIQINPGALVTSPTTFLVGGNFTNDGAFFAGSSRNVTFSGTSLLLGVNINTTNFYDIIISGGATVTGPTTLNLLGSFTNNGSYIAGTGLVAFIGNVENKLITGSTNTQFYDLSMSKTNGGTSVTISSPQTVTNSLTLTDGILSNPSGNLTIVSGATLTRVSTGSIITTSPLGGPWNLIYTNLGIVTGLEIPASGILSSLTVNLNVNRTVTLTQSITVQNAFTIVNVQRFFNSGTNNVSVGSFTSNGIFTAPSSAATTGLTVSGNFVNNGTFTHASGLTTFNGTTDLSGTSTTTFNRITISGTLNALTNFNAAGHFTNNGTFSAGTSTVSFTGAALQNISGSAPLTTFRNITISNITSPVSVSMESNINLIGTLTLAANAKLDADGSSGTAVLTLLSTGDAPAVDANIATLPTTAQVLGNVTVQRFFRPADNFDRFISSPVSNAPVSQLQASQPAGSFPVTGGFTGTSFPCTGCNNNGHNFRYYREITPGIINVGYTAWITSNTNTLVPGVGYDAFMWNGTSNTTVSLRGTINRGNISLGASGGITHTNNGNASADGWNLLGNPYPSAIRWSNTPGHWTNTNIDATVWIWDVVGRVWVSFTDGIIASGQGFWVYAPAVGNASVTVTEQAKSVAGAGSYYRIREEDKPALTISLSDQVVTDYAFVIQDAVATDEFDMGLDQPKLELGIERLSVSLLDTREKKLARYGVKEKEERDIPIYVNADAEGEYTLSFNSVNAFEGFDRYYLIDSQLGVSAKISEGSYQFKMTPSTSTERFYLSLSPVVEGASEYQVKVSCYPNPTSDRLVVAVNSDHVQSIDLIDHMGKPVNNISFETNHGVTQGEINMETCSGGVYFVKVVVAGKLFIQKIIKY